MSNNREVDEGVNNIESYLDPFISIGVTYN